MSRIKEHLDAFADMGTARISADHLSAAIAFAGHAVFVCDDVGENRPIQSMDSNRLGIDLDPPAFLNMSHGSLNGSLLRNELFSAKSQELLNVHGAASLSEIRIVL